MSEELESCPFCGSEALLYYSPSYVVTYGVGCSNTECHVYTGYGMKLYETKAEAIEAWNTRAESGDFLKEIYDWAYSGMEGCDEPEWSLFTGIVGVIAKYYRETSKPRNIPDDYMDIEF